MASARHLQGFASVLLSVAGCAWWPARRGTHRPYWRWFGAYALLLLFAMPVRAEPPVVSLDALPRGPLGEFSHYLQEQPDAPLSLDAVRVALANQAFQPLSRATPSLGIGEPPTWFHLPLQNPDAEARPLRLLIGASWLDEIDIYQVQDGQPVQQWAAGAGILIDVIVGVGVPMLVLGLYHLLSRRAAPGVARIAALPPASIDEGAATSASDAPRIVALTVGASGLMLWLTALTASAEDRGTLFPTGAVLVVLALFSEWIGRRAARRAGLEARHGEAV